MKTKIERPTVAAMPDDTEEDPVSMRDLSRDRIGDVFDRRLAETDPWLGDIAKSGWEETPEPPDEEYEKFIAEKGTEELDPESLEAVEVQMKEEFEEMSANQKKMWRAAVDEFGHGSKATPFTINDLVDVSGVKRNTIKPYMGKFTDDMGIFEFTGEKDGNSKLYKCKKPYKVTVSTDGGRLMGEWTRIEWGDLLDKMDDVEFDDEWDWFASKNWDPWTEFVRKNREIAHHLDELDYLQRRKLLNPKKREKARLRGLKYAREELKEMLQKFREVFHILQSMVKVYFEGEMTWADKNDVEIAKMSYEENRPSVRLKKASTRLNAIQYAILDTYIRPLISLVPEHNTTIPATVEQGNRVKQMKQCVGSWLVWVSTCAEDSLK